MFSKSYASKIPGGPAKPLTIPDIEARVIKVIKDYDKITDEKVNCYEHFLIGSVFFFFRFFYFSLVQTIRCWQSNVNKSNANVINKRHYSAKQPLSLKLIQERVLLVLNLYDKVDPAKVLRKIQFQFICADLIRLEGHKTIDLNASDVLYQWIYSDWNYVL